MCVDILQRRCCMCSTISCNIFLFLKHIVGFIGLQMASDVQAEAKNRLGTSQKVKADQEWWWGGGRVSTEGAHSLLRGYCYTN